MFILIRQGSEYRLESSNRDDVVDLFNETDVLAVAAGQRAADDDGVQVHVFGAAAGGKHAVLGTKASEEHGIYTECLELFGQTGTVEGVAVCLGDTDITGEGLKASGRSNPS